MKRDFRITDNECLFTAVQQAEAVLPFFCWEHEVLNEGDYSSFHLQAQWEGLTGVCQSLRSRGIHSRVVFGEIVEQLDLLHNLFLLMFFIPTRKQETWLLSSGTKWCKNGVGNGM